MKSIFNGAGYTQSAIGIISEDAGNARLSVQQLEAVLHELFKTNDKKEIYVTTALVDLAVKSRETKKEIDALVQGMEAYHAVMNRGSMKGNEYQAFAGFLEQYGSIEKAEARLVQLQDLYADIRRQIDAATAAIGSEEAATSALGTALAVVGKGAAAFALIAAGAKKAIAPVVKLTNRIGDLMAQYNPLSIMMRNLGNSLHSLFVRVKRVLVYSTIVSFFRMVKNEIGGFLKQNKELMQALGQCKGAWITAFMPLYNYVIPKLISLIN